MAIWPFGRIGKKQIKNVPEEVQEYYQSERRERVGIAWLLALATLITTIVLAIGLYFGGRWAWREIFGNEEQTTTEQQEGTQQGQPESEGQGSEQETQPSGGNEGQNTQPTPQPAQPAPQQSAQPTNGQNLTNTGPADTLAAFIGASILGTLGYQVYIRKKLTNN